MSVSFIESQMQSKIQEMMNLLTQLQIEKNKTENTQSQEKNQLVKQNQDLFELNQWYQKKLDKKLKKIESLKKKNKDLQKKLRAYDTYGHENVPKMGTFGTLDEIELEAEEDEVQCIEPPVITRKIKIEDLTKDEPVLEPDDQEMLDELVEIATRAVRKGFLEVKQLKKNATMVDLEVQEDHEVQDHAVQEQEEDHEVQEEVEEEVEVEQEEEEDHEDHEVQEEEVQEEEQEEEVEVEEEEEIEVEVEEEDHEVQEVEVEEEEVEVEEEEVEVEEEEVEVEVEVEVEDHEVQVEVEQEEVEVEEEEDHEVQEVEQEEEEEEEQELILVKINKKNYYTTNETNGEIYAIEEDESIGDQVGNYKNGKAFFLPKK